MGLVVLSRRNRSYLKTGKRRMILLWRRWKRRLPVDGSGVNMANVIKLAHFTDKKNVFIINKMGKLYGAVAFKIRFAPLIDTGHWHRIRMWSERIEDNFVVVMWSVTSMCIKRIHCQRLPMKGIQCSMLPFDWIVWLSPVTLTRVGLKLVSSQMIFSIRFM